MKSLLATLRSHVFEAMSRAFGADAEGADPLVRPSADAKFGDYQSNVAMGLAKRLGAKPREVAAKIVAALSPAALEMIEPPQIAGPGFINLQLKTSHLQSALKAIPPAPGSEADQSRDRLGIDPVAASEKQTVIIDYSSPNVAKEMHVGHLRSTVIGDTFARALAFEGHDVVRQNHLGDWGTQFGRIILALWHICMTRRRGDNASGLGALADQLLSPETPEDARLALLNQRQRIHQQDLDADPEGRDFHDFINGYEAGFDELLPAYRFVNAVEKAAEGRDLIVRQPGAGPLPLSAVSRHVAAMLQGKTGQDNEQEMAAWRKARQATLAECGRIYRRLNVVLVDADARGESFYEPLLPGVVEEIRKTLSELRGEGDALRAVCRVDQGAICVFLEKPNGDPAFKGPQGDPLPMIIRKSDGASLYSTTDLAAILFRVAHPTRNPIKVATESLATALGKLEGGLGADRVIYVVGAPQKLHFEMLFPTADALGWTTRAGKPPVRLEHVAFGSVLGEDRKMLRTRSGEAVRLRDLLDEAVQRAEAQIRATESDPAKSRGFADAEIKQIAETVGIAAVKYADLCQNRNTDYVFSWKKMLALQGNTAPYMLYAYARIRSIYRKGADAEGTVPDWTSAAIRIDAPAERELAVKILQLAETIDAVGEALLPSYLCEYLYDLSGRFMSFYEQCPVLSAENAATTASRLRICDLTARTLRLGLGLLGIPTLERM
jgi:arginyl-tRNA synthetase